MRMPPSTGPMATEAPVTAPKAPNAMPRSRPWKAGAHQRQRGGEHHAAADALHRAEQVQVQRRVHQAAAQRGQREQHQADREHPAAADQVGHRARHQQGGGQPQRVGVHHPLQVAERAVQVLLDAGQRDVHDRDVQQEHEDAGQDGREGPPLAIHSGANGTPRPKASDPGRRITPWWSSSASIPAPRIRATAWCSRAAACSRPWTAASSRPPPSTPLEQRLAQIHADVCALIDEHEPGRPGHRGALLRRQRQQRVRGRPGPRRRAAGRRRGRHPLLLLHAPADQAGGLRLGPGRQGPGAADGGHPAAPARATRARPRRRRAGRRHLPRQRGAHARGAGGVRRDRPRQRRGRCSARDGEVILDTAGGLGYRLSVSAETLRQGARARAARSPCTPTWSCATTPCSSTASPPTPSATCS